MTKRRGVMLLLVLVCLALLGALVVPLATLSGVTALESGYRTATLRHRLAADSALALLPTVLAQDAQLDRQLDGTNRARWSFDLEDLSVDVLIQDDTAKLPLAIAGEAERRHPGTSALRVLRAQLALPLLAVTPPEHGEDAGDHIRFRSHICLDDCFVEPNDAALYGRPDKAPAWAQYVTPLGRAVHVYRADPAVLEAALADLRSGLGQELARKRAAQPHGTIEELLSRIELPESVRRLVRERLTLQTERYSLLIRTRLGADVRQRYVLCTAAAPREVLLDWEVAP